MPHPLIAQLRFTRSEWLRALAGVPAADAEIRLLPMTLILRKNQGFQFCSIFHKTNSMDFSLIIGCQHKQVNYY